MNVGVTQLVLPPRTAQAVLDRMRAGRTVLSETEQLKGQAERRPCRTAARPRLTRSARFADQRAAEIRGEGEQENRQVLRAMSEAQDLAVFLQWLDALQDLAVAVHDRCVAFEFRAASSQSRFGDRSRGIPQPATTQPDIAGTPGQPAGMSIKPSSAAKEPNDG